MTQRLHPLVIALLLAGLLGAYALPWVVNPGAALTVGAYDLAEWVSLHPGARSQTPPLLASLLLRLPLVGLTWLLVLPTLRPLFGNVGGLRLVAAALLMIAQLPPPEFITNLGDINYSQQAALALMSFTGSAGLLTGILARWQAVIALMIGAGCAGCAVVGSTEALRLMHEFSLPARLGLGVIVFVIGCGIVCGYSGWQLWQGRLITSHSRTHPAAALLTRGS